MTKENSGYLPVVLYRQVGPTASKMNARNRVALPRMVFRNVVALMAKRHKISEAKLPHPSDTTLRSHCYFPFSQSFIQNSQTNEHESREVSDCLVGWTFAPKVLVRILYSPIDSREASLA